MEKTIINSLPQGTILHGMTYDYQILKALGQGAFGITYLTEVKLRGELGTVNATVYVAIKEFFMHEINGRDNTFVTSSNKEGLYDKYKKKFIGEAKNLNKLKHDNIIKVIEAFEANNTVYYSMEFIDGGSLDDLITRRGFLTEEETISYTKQIASALSFMHSRNMLHLDIKPSNIMLRDGSAVLIDFGLSKQFDDDGNPESSTTIGGGTPGYAPLEQANFHGDTSNGLPMTMDIYALGATMFKMFTGHRPPVASDIMNDGFPAHELKERGVADSVIELVGEAMSARHKKRIPDAKMLLERLRKIQNFQDEDIVLKEAPQRLGDGLLSILEAVKEKKERNQSEPEVTVIDYKERIYLKGVKKILFSYCEGLTSIPSDSFQVEITEQLLIISKGIHPLSGVYGGITRPDFILPFSKNQMQSLISKLNTLHLYKYHGETIEGEPGGFHMRLLINTEDPNGVVDVYHEGNVIRQLGTLRGDVNLLLDEIKKISPILNDVLIQDKLTSKKTAPNNNKSSLYADFSEKMGWLIVVMVAFINIISPILLIVVMLFGIDVFIGYPYVSCMVAAYGALSLFLTIKLKMFDNLPIINIIYVLIDLFLLIVGVIGIIDQVMKTYEIL